MATSVELVTSQWKEIETLGNNIATMTDDLDDILKSIDSMETKIQELFPKIDTSIDKTNEALDKVNKDVPFIADQAAHLYIIEQNMRNLVIIISVVTTLTAGLVVILIYNSIKKAVT